MARTYRKKSKFVPSSSSSSTKSPEASHAGSSYPPFGNKRHLGHFPVTTRLPGMNKNESITTRVPCNIHTILPDRVSQDLTQIKVVLPQASQLPRSASFYSSSSSSSSTPKNIAPSIGNSTSSLSLPDTTNTTVSPSNSHTALSHQKWVPPTSAVTPSSSEGIQKETFPIVDSLMAQGNEYDPYYHPYYPHVSPGALGFEFDRYSGMVMGPGNSQPLPPQPMLQVPQMYDPYGTMNQPSLPMPPPPPPPFAFVYYPGPDGAPVPSGPMYMYPQ